MLLEERRRGGGERERGRRGEGRKEEGRGEEGGNRDKDLHPHSDDVTLFDCDLFTWMSSTQADGCRLGFTISLAMQP